MGCGEQPEEFAALVAPEAAHGLAVGGAWGGASGEVGAGM